MGHTRQTAWRAGISADTRPTMSFRRENELRKHFGHYGNSCLFYCQHLKAGGDWIDDLRF